MKHWWGYNRAVQPYRFTCALATMIALCLISAQAFGQEFEQEAKTGQDSSMPRLKRNPPPDASPSTDGLPSADSGGAEALDSLVTLRLTGGEVSGKQRGLGKARVIAEVENQGGRELTGIRIAAYYATQDSLPPADARWWVHEFVFEPPLQPGATTSLRFSDEDAAEYVYLEIRHIVYGAGITYAGRNPKLRDGLVLRDGELYVSTRDLVDLIGGKLSFESKSGYVTLEIGAYTLRIKKDRYSAKLNGESIDLKHLPVEIKDRSFVCAEEIARLLGLTSDWDEEGLTLNLSGGA